MPYNKLLLTSLARYVQKNIGPRFFCTNLALRARSACTKKTLVQQFSVQTSGSVKKKLLIHSVPTNRNHVNYIPLQQIELYQVINIQQIQSEERFIVGG
jgi:hypothetical protein